MSESIYEHNCPKCEFVGNWRLEGNLSDAYVCQKLSRHNETVTNVVFRWGNSDEDTGYLPVDYAYEKKATVYCAVYEKWQKQKASNPSNKVLDTVTEVVSSPTVTNNSQNVPPFTLKDILDAANRFYFDGYLTEYFDEKGDKPAVAGSGDLLAQFIVAELRETFTEGLPNNEKVAIALHAIDTAIRDLQCVCRGLSSLPITKS